MNDKKRKIKDYSGNKLMNQTNANSEEFRKQSKFQEEFLKAISDYDDNKIKVEFFRFNELKKNFYELENKFINTEKEFKELKSDFKKQINKESNAMLFLISLFGIFATMFIFTITSVDVARFMSDKWWIILVFGCINILINLLMLYIVFIKRK